MNGGWIGVDLDGTLAEYTSWDGPESIGKPIPLMVERVKKWLSEGTDVRIFTARVHPNYTNQKVVDVIVAWCEEHLGRPLQVTSCKDFAMIELWDDRCVQVIPNTGQRADGME